MDEKVEESTSETETVEAGVRATRKSGESGLPADEATAATPEKTGQMPGSPTPATVRSLDLNELQEFSGKQLKALARDLDLFLQPTRSRHQHILDIVRVALTGGATLTAEGFLDQVSDSFAMLRWPKFNFLPVPEDVAEHISQGGHGDRTDLRLATYRWMNAHLKQDRGPVQEATDPPIEGKRLR